MSTPADKPKTVLEALTAITDVFKKGGVESPRLEAEMLLAHVLGVARIQLYVRHDQPLSADELGRYGELARRRGRHEPVHYILGHREFWSLDLMVEKGVLIPRPDTECLVEEALAYLKGLAQAEPLVADVGTGSGAIAIALATEVPALRVFAGDIAEVPLRVAADNVRRHHVEGRVSVVRAHLLAELAHAAGRRFDLVVSNPPYITEAELATLEPHVLKEPREALAGGVDGLDVVRALVSELPAGLEQGGAVFIEIGAAQGDSVRALLAPSFAEVRVRKDYAGLDRVVVAVGFKP